MVILSIPFGRIPTAAALFASVPSDTVVIDTSRYFSQLNGAIEAVDDGQVESLWVAEQLGPPPTAPSWVWRTWGRPWKRPTGPRPHATVTA